jgi:hypothetical protein
VRAGQKNTHADHRLVRCSLPTRHSFTTRSVSRRRITRNIRDRENFYGRGGGVGRGLAVGAGLGVELAVAVAVAVGVAVAVAVAVAVGVGVNVAVAVAVGVAVGAHAEGVPVAVGVGLGLGVGDGVPTAAAISTRPYPYTLLGGPAVPHCTEAIKTAVLSSASRLAWMSCRRLGIAHHSNAIAPAICGVAMEVPLAVP